MNLIGLFDSVGIFQVKYYGITSEGDSCAKRTEGARFFPMTPSLFTRRYI
jgi:hypothetical protein